MKTFFYLSLVSILTMLFISCAFAGTTVITINEDIEGTGGIDAGTSSQWDNNYENVKGAMFWNGSQWAVNDTWAHKYFTDMRNGGKRLLEYEPAVTVSTSTTVGPYTITKNEYSYSSNSLSNTGGRWDFTCTEYEITGPDGAKIILRSRGVGESGAFFNVYVQNPDGSTGTSAMVGDPVWINYSADARTATNMSRSINSSGVSGNLPNVNARYMMDINGGSDMGGITHELQTGSLSGIDVNTLGGVSAFTVGYTLKYMDNGVLKQMSFNPEAQSTYVPPPPTGGGDGGGGGGD